MQKIDPPSKEELENLLFDKLLSKKKVATHYSVSRKTLNSWMRQYDLLNKTPVELQKLKRERTRLLKREALKGGTVIKSGFNSEFIEEYAIEAESEKAKRQERLRKRKEKKEAVSDEV